eukprot:CAMPEP_0205807726 /NCGR_PEP_ID=MMETSP0205-20121125/11495_1 /ASSEMBLY_ACC=CAM_ASM_000278 /TAXON_ID=36767 /ORGANISM="Euplotes focardii, Strain TN1" /LENGTH=142 /DNA_ID=CAMNT_0053082323 /DNA_START=117 /DNA_END=541 /DNA_ORIENTATION=+
MIDSNRGKVINQNIKNKKKNTNEESYQREGEVSDGDEDSEEKCISKPTTKLTGYEQIIEYQEPNGHFTQLPEKYSIYNSIEIPEEISSNLKESVEGNLIWTTILCLLLLEKHYGKKKDEWLMIAKKAKSYLKKNMINIVDYS